MAAAASSTACVRAGAESACKQMHSAYSTHAWQRPRGTKREGTADVVVHGDLMAVHSILYTETESKAQYLATLTLTPAHMWLRFPPRPPASPLAPAADERGSDEQQAREDASAHQQQRRRLVSILCAAVKSVSASIHAVARALFVDDGVRRKRYSGYIRSAVVSVTLASTVTMSSPVLRVSVRPLLVSECSEVQRGEERELRGPEHVLVALDEQQSSTMAVWQQPPHICASLQRDGECDHERPECSHRRTRNGPSGGE